MLGAGTYGGAETTGPSVFLPQRQSYNPGGLEWDSDPEPSDFEVWTYAYDVSGLQEVTLRWRVDADGTNPLSSTDNETYAGGPEVGAWNSESMASSDVAPPANIMSPTYRALRYGAMITGQEDALVDYYVEAVDANGNVTRSDIQHVYVGANLSPGGDAVTIGPDPAVAGQPVTITYDPTGGQLAGAAEVYLHQGFDDWDAVVAPDASMNWNATEGYWDITVPVSTNATQLDLVFNDGSGNWDNNNGQDWHFDVIDTADFNGDGDVDGDDFLAWQRGRGMTGASPHNGDADGNGTVDAVDLVIWKQQFGQPSAILSASHAVPEPCSWGLMIGAALAIIAIGRKKRPR